VEELAGLFLLALLAAIFIRLVKGGWSGHGGVTDWLRAKALGQTTPAK
jgi:hypothetical protein